MQCLLLSQLVHWSSQFLSKSDNNENLNMRLGTGMMGFSACMHLVMDPQNSKLEVIIVCHPHT